MDTIREANKQLFREDKTRTLMKTAASVLSELEEYLCVTLFAGCLYSLAVTSVHISYNFENLGGKY